LGGNREAGGRQAKGKRRRDRSVHAISCNVWGISIVAYSRMPTQWP